MAKITPLDAWIAGKIGQPGGAPLRSETLQAYQLERLRQTLQLCRQRSPFYRKHLAQAPAELADLAALQEFPFTTAEDLRQHGRQFLCISQGDIQRVVTLDSSGTTGSPKRLYFSAHDQELTIDFFRTGMSTFTAPGERVLILLPGERPGSVGDLLASGLERLGAAGIQHGPVVDALKTLEVMQDQAIHGLVGAPWQVLALARFARRLKFAWQFKSALLTTDHVPQAIRQEVEAVFGCRVYNHYGMTEMGLGGGVECQERRGYHLREADLYFEIVDERSGQPLPPGQPGEIVFSTLRREGMPLLRYRTGDISRFLPEPCTCGTCLKTLETVRYRAAGRIAFGDGELTLADLDEALFGLAGLINFAASFRPAQTNPGQPARLSIQLWMLAGEETGACQGARQRLEALTSVGYAQQTGELDLHLTAQTIGPAILASMSKRRIRSSIDVGITG